MTSETTNLTPIPTEEFHDSFFHKDEFHERDLYYTDLADYREVYIATKYVQEVMDEKWDLLKATKYTEVLSSGYWHSFTSKLLG